MKTGSPGRWTDEWMGEYYLVGGCVGNKWMNGWVMSSQGVGGVDK